jgi:hypothetical protein
MVERAAAGEAASSPQPPEAGVRRARLYGFLFAAENRNRQTMSSSQYGEGDERQQHVLAAERADNPLADAAALTLVLHEPNGQIRRTANTGWLPP